MKSVISYRRAGRATERPSNLSVLITFGALVAMWAPIYLALLSRFGGGIVERTEALEWSLVIVGVFGLGSVIVLAWKDTRDPRWRAAHGLRLRRSARTR